MTHPTIDRFATGGLKLSSALALVMLLGGCNLMSRLNEMGEQPKLTAIENPTTQKGYQPVSMPMPMPETSLRTSNSLWRPGARQFFKDQRAARVGDIVTINVEVADKATIDNNTKRTRTTTDTVGLTNFFGTEAVTGSNTTSTISNILSGASPGSLVNATSNSEYEGKGNTNRTETVSMQMAGVVTQVLPNGNLVIQGRQEVRVNYEVREVMISGVIRPEDITAQNTIAHTKIAEARISYGGRGQLMDVQQPRYGTQLFDILFPF
jgi:flagellar L-ring protein precursor FlgH